MPHVTQVTDFAGHIGYALQQTGEIENTLG